MSIDVGVATAVASSVAALAAIVIQLDGLTARSRAYRRLGQLERLPLTDLQRWPASEIRAIEFARLTAIHNTLLEISTIELQYVFRKRSRRLWAWLNAALMLVIGTAIVIVWFSIVPRDLKRSPVLESFSALALIALLISLYIAVEKSYLSWLARTWIKASPAVLASPRPLNETIKEVLDNKWEQRAFRIIAEKVPIIPSSDLLIGWGLVRSDGPDWAWIPRQSQHHESAAESSST